MMARRASYKDSIRLSYQVSVALFSIYAAIYAVLIFVKAATFTTILPGGTLLTVLFSIGIMKFAEYFYRHMIEASKFLWEEVKEFEEDSEGIFPEKRNEYLVFPVIFFIGIMSYYSAVDFALNNLTIPNKHLLLLIRTDFDLLEILQAILWQLLVASSAVMPLSGSVGFYFTLKHHLFPENICSNCSDVVKPSQDYCSNCGSEVGATYTKGDYLKQLFGLSTEENTDLENREIKN